MAQALDQAPRGNTKSLVASKCRAYCFTAWDYKNIKWDETKMKYIVVGKEICPKTKKVHYQGFVYFKNQVTMSGVKKYVGNDAHIEMKSKKSTNSQAINYCKKDGNFIEYGEQPNDNGVKNIKELVDKYDNVKDFAFNESETFCQYRNGIYDLYRFKSEGYAGPRNVIWIYGPSGIGKSRLARMICQDNPISYKNGFFEYDSEREVIWDDFRSYELPLTDLLRITDVYKTKVNIKGTRAVWWNVEKIVFTCIKPPWEMYQDKDENIYQIKRRASGFINLNIAHEIKYKKTNKYKIVN